MIDWNDGVDFMVGNRFLEAASATNETTTSGDNSGQTIKDSLAIYGSFFAVFFTIYCIVRKKFPRVYAVRQWSPQIKSSLASNQFGYLSWLWKVYSFSQDDLLEGIGLDALCFLRILNMGFRLACVGCFNSLWLFPVYITSEQDPDITVDDNIKEVTVNTMRPGDPRFVATVVAAYVFFGYTFYTMFYEFRWFIAQRHNWLRKFNQRNYSVLVRNIPDEMRSDAALMKHFQRLYGQERVLVAHVCLFLPDLESLVADRNECIANLEHVLAELAIYGERPRHTLLFKAVSRSCRYRRPTYGNQTPSDDPTNNSEVDSIDFYAAELNKLNDEINEIINKIEEQQLLLPQLENGSTSFQNSSFSLGACPPDNSWKGVYTIAPITSDGDAPATDENRIGKDSHVGRQKVETPFLHDLKSEETALTGSSRPADAIDESPPSVSTNISDSNTAQIDGVVEIFKKGMEDAKERVQQVIIAVTSYGDVKESSAGFVTFTSLAAAQGALQMSQHPGPFVLEIEAAPDEPCNIYWGNIRQELSVLQTGRLISVVLTIVICLGWTVVVTFIVNLTNVEHIESNLPDSWHQVLADNPWFQDLLALISPLLLMVFNSALLPILLESVTKIEVPASVSVFRASAFLKMALFTVIQTFFVSLISGSVLQALGNVFDSPTEFIGLLARALPEQSAYFIQLLIADTCVGTLVELFRISPVLYATLRSCIGRRLTEKERSQRFGLLRPLSDVTLIYFNRAQASFLLYFMILFVYSAISPLVNWCCLFFFLFLRSVYRHEFIFNLPNTPDSGGQNWIYFMRILLACIVIAQLTLMGFLTLKEFPISIPLMVPLLIITCLFIVYLHQRHFSKGQYLAGTTCTEQDLENEEDEIDYNLFKNKYKNPALLARVVDADWDSGKKEAGIPLDEEHQPPTVMKEVAFDKEAAVSSNTSIPKDTTLKVENNIYEVDKVTVQECGGIEREVEGNALNTGLNLN